MSDQFIAEIRMVGFNFAPDGWAKCDGQLLPIAQNTALFALIGTTYGGDGQTTFAVPDLRGNLPLNQGAGPGLTPRALGEIGGSENVTLTIAAMPSHTHPLWADPEKADDNDPGASLKLATSVRGSMYNTGNLQTMHPASTTPAGGNQPHANQQPYLVVNFVISLQGVFPSFQ